MNNIYLNIIGSECFFNLLYELGLNIIATPNNNQKFNIQSPVVRIIFVEKFSITEVKKYFHQNTPTVFLLKDRDYLKKNKLSLLQFHTYLFMPIEVLTLREILNILVIKYNFFKKSKIIINNYEIDSNQRIIIKSGIKVKLTEKELELILLLNKNNGLEKSFLLKNIWNRNSDLDSHAFETHLHRLRKKISKFFKDTEFIIEKNSLYYLSK